MDARMYEKLEEKLECELEKLAKSEQPLTMQTLDQIDKLSHALKNVYKVHMGYEGEYSGAGWEIHGGAYPAPHHDSGHSMRGMSYHDGGSSYGSRGMSYGDGMSYARGRGRNAHRDSMGRYASAADSRDEMLEHLNEMMSMAETEKEREAIRECMNCIGK